MVTKTYISKMATIVSDDTINTGINPVSELVYGANVTRMLLYFNHEKVKTLVQDKTYPHIEKLKHRLKIFNCGAIDFTKLHEQNISSISSAAKIRASSFDLIFFLIPKYWDGGKGFDYAETFFNQGYYGDGCSRQSILQDSAKTISRDGVNWYESRNGYKWDEEGIYSNDTLSREYDNFSCDNGSVVIIGRQHFDIGNEDISIDITDIFNKFILNDIPNYGIGVAFSPMLELTKDAVDNYVGFFTHKTNTFFQPYVETTYDEVISDDRSNFVLDKKNKLYLYANIGDSLVNLDEMPSCSINGIDYTVKQATKGVYYIDILLTSKEYQPNTMLYDTWSNIKYEGVALDDIELDFVIHSKDSYFNIGSSLKTYGRVSPTLSGIRHNENIYRGDIRKIDIIQQIPYSKGIGVLSNDTYYRLYVKDGQREITCIDYTKVNKGIGSNYFFIDTSILIPNQYYIDIKTIRNNEVIVSHEAVVFKVVQKLTTELYTN